MEMRESKIADEDHMRHAMKSIFEANQEEIN
jgi:hypothetical protein